jgi:hypothetical protein
MSPSSSRGHPDHGRRENPPATVTTSAQSEHRPGEKCRQFHSIRHLAINGSCFEFAKADVLPPQLKFESLPSGNLFYPHRSSPATVAPPGPPGNHSNHSPLKLAKSFQCPGMADLICCNADTVLAEDGRRILRSEWNRKEMLDCCLGFAKSTPSQADRKNRQQTNARKKNPRP